MKKKLLFSLLALAAMVVACGDDDDEKVYPSIVTEMAMMRSDDACMIYSFTNDSARSFTLSKPIDTGVKNGLWRMLVGYVLEDDGKATVHSLERVVATRDSTDIADVRHDPVGFVSAWLGGGFINLHLAPKTQGGKHYWGYVRKGLRSNTAGGTTLSIALHHRQGSDPQAYSTDAYLSISLDSLAAEPGSPDSVELSIQTFEGTTKKSFGLSR